MLINHHARLPDIIHHQWELDCCVSTKLAETLQTDDHPVNSSFIPFRCVESRSPVNFQIVFGYFSSYLSFYWFFFGGWEGKKDTTRVQLINLRVLIEELCLLSWKLVYRELIWLNHCFLEKETKCLVLHLNLYYHFHLQTRLPPFRSRFPPVKLLLGAITERNASIDRNNNCLILHSLIVVRQRRR